MIHLLSEAGQAALRQFVDRSTLFAFDLDGTLAPIVADPARIEIPEKIRKQLTYLNRVAPVAIISGRARGDARAHLGFDPRFLIGNNRRERAIQIKGKKGRAINKIMECDLTGIAEQIDHRIPLIMNFD